VLCWEQADHHQKITDATIAPADVAAATIAPIKSAAAPLLLHPMLLLLLLSLGG
jgi:hypothetical protein